MRPATRRLLSLLLPLLLVFAQLGAARHEIGHLQAPVAQSGEAATASKKDLPLDKLCEVCLAFAHLTTAAKPEVPSLPLLRFEHARAPHDAVHAIDADAPALRSRGPPLSL